jgi:8-amino-7-oxononanoate synthase
MTSPATGHFAHLQELIGLATGPDFYPFIPTLQTEPTRPVVEIGGRELLFFSSASYLGLAHDPRVIEAAERALHRWGVGACASKLLGGRTEVHDELEAEVARFMGAPAALVFNAVTLVSQGVTSAVLDPPLLSALGPRLSNPVLPTKALFVDRDVHASVLDALAKGRSDKVYFHAHNDLAALERNLQKSDHAIKMVFNDGLYSMRGDLCPLPELVALAERYGALLYLDDAHGTGVLGAHGRGTGEHFGLQDRVHIYIGSFAKALGVMGGFVIGPQPFIDYLRISARTYMFMGAMAPSMAAAIVCGLQIAQAEPWRRERLHHNADLLRGRLRAAGLTVLGASPIVPLLVGDELAAVQIARDLYDAGVFVPPIRFPGVARGEALLRFSVTCEHTDEQLERAAALTIDLARRRGLEGAP